jgi:hypothetical protein
MWKDRFLQQVAVLERLGLVDVWSDSKIKAGTVWLDEIEAALTSAQVAVLLVSPAFLASNFIWYNEMPRIIAHSKQGMEILPLIVRPCPWRLQDELARLQARPKDGRALSQGSDSQIDLDLSDFAYELAKHIGRSSTDKIPTTPTRNPENRKKTPADLTGTWEGTYNKSRVLRLVIAHKGEESFWGKMEYSKEGTTTRIEGIIHEQWSSRDPKWAQVDRSDDNSRLAVTFRETGYDKQGTSSISFDGEYRAIIDGDVMTGGWFAETRLVGTFNLQRNRKGVSARASRATD